MKVNRILVPVDFSEVTDSVVKTAVSIATRSQASITLFHVTGKQDHEEAAAKMKSVAKTFDPQSAVDCGFVVAAGDILQKISGAANPEDFDLMVIGSHGYKGMREKLFGTDILKLLKETAVPTLVIQIGYSLSGEGLDKILMPVGSHKNIDKQIDATAMISMLFDAVVHVFTVIKPGAESSDEIQKNIRKILSEFDSRNVSYERIRETATSFSVGYGRHILDYANRKDITLITFIANAAREYYYVADSDKATMLTNDAKIPILSVSEKGL